MTKIKESSTIQANKKSVFRECPITYAMDKVGSYWKPIILYHLLAGPRRYGELRQAIPAITEKMLIQHLKQLEADGLVHRKALPVVPPHVTYKLTVSGRRLAPVLYALAEWAFADGKKRSKTFGRQLEQFGKAI